LSLEMDILKESLLEAFCLRVSISAEVMLDIFLPILIWRLYFLLLAPSKWKFFLKLSISTFSPAKMASNWHLTSYKSLSKVVPFS
jgi:hypothetical protein